MFLELISSAENNSVIFFYSQTWFWNLLTTYICNHFRRDGIEVTALLGIPYKVRSLSSVIVARLTASCVRLRVFPIDSGWLSESHADEPATNLEDTWHSTNPKRTEIGICGACTCLTDVSVVFDSVSNSTPHHHFVFTARVMFCVDKAGSRSQPVHRIRRILWPLAYLVPSPVAPIASDIMVPCEKM